MSERDRIILANLAAFRFLPTRHIQRLHFTDDASDLAATRPAARARQRLQDPGVVPALERRIRKNPRGAVAPRGFQPDSSGGVET
jgi:hypothetical protein